MQIEQLGMCHHIFVQAGHDDERADKDKEYDEHTKRER
jgi:hypothetical protein